MDEWWILIERTVLPEHHKSAPNVTTLDLPSLLLVGTSCVISHPSLEAFNPTHAAFHNHRTLT